MMGPRVTIATKKRVLDFVFCGVVFMMGFGVYVDPVFCVASGFLVVGAGYGDPVVLDLELFDGTLTLSFLWGMGVGGGSQVYYGY